MKATLRKMGNSQGVLIPKAILTQLAITDELDMTVEDGAIVLRKPAETAAPDAAVAAIKFSLETDDALLFLRYWVHGDFDVIRRNWPDAPEDIFIGADMQYKTAQDK